jgi:hypothetical protein
MVSPFWIVLSLLIKPVSVHPDWSRKNSRMKQSAPVVRPLIIADEFHQ